MELGVFIAAIKKELIRICELDLTPTTGIILIYVKILTRSENMSISNTLLSPKIH
jgi:hypothetical protein